MRRVTAAGAGSRLRGERSTMGEEKRTAPPPTSSSSSASSSAEDDAGRAASRLFRSKAVTGRRPHAYSTSAAAAAATGGVAGEGGGAVMERLDSDGTMNSGGDSDSSEEIHYGPGFVSRLKSRYMSVALRSSTRGSTGILRRTASLEDFLEKDKEETRIEIYDKVPSSKAHQQGRHHRRSDDVPDSSAASKERRKHPASPTKYGSSKTRRDSIKRAQSVEVLSISEQSSGTSSSGSSELSSPTRQHRLPMRYIFEPPAQSPPQGGVEAPPPLPPKGERSIDKVVNSLANDVAVVDKTGPPSRPSVAQPPPLVRAIDASAGRRPLYKRRSSSLLFGVEEKELPAPDTVKETRKIFESRSGRAPVPSYRTLGVKSKSATALYPSRSRSVDGRLARRDPEDSVQTRQQSAISSSQQRQSRPSQSVAPQPSPRGPAATAVASAALASSSKPSLPSKPAHLTPTKTSTHRTSHGNSPSSYAPAPFRKKSEESVTAGIVSVSSFVVPPLRHIKGETPPKKEEDQLGAERYSRLAREELDKDDEGIKLVSSDSISRIRQGGNSVSFNFKGNANGAGNRNYLPKSGGSLDKENSVGRQVGVIRPITREVINKNHANNAKSSAVDKTEKPKEVIYLERQSVKQPTKSWTSTEPSGKSDRAGKHEFSDRSNKPKPLEEHTVMPVKVEPKKDEKNEVLLVSRRDLPSSPKLLKRQEKVEEVEERRELAVSKSEKKPRPPSSSFERVSEARNGHHDGVEDGAKRDKEIISSRHERERLTSPPPPSLQATSASGGGSYRDSWKKRTEEQNTMVFNFVNSEKEVSHIENDGRDITKRNSSSGKAKKKRNLALAKVRKEFPPPPRSHRKYF